jgi:hypothetical protein
MSAGPLEEKHEQRVKLNEDAEAIARLICEELGLDPDALEIGEHGFAVKNWEHFYNRALNGLAEWRAISRWALTQA